MASSGLTGLGGFSGEGVTAASPANRGVPPARRWSWVLLATVGFLPGAVFALGEEIGWRGLLVPELARMTSFTRRVLDQRRGLVRLPLSIDPLLGLHQRGSELVCAPRLHLDGGRRLVHLRLVPAQVGQRLDGGLPSCQPQPVRPGDFRSPDRGPGLTKYFTTEFGAGLAVAYAVAAWYFWRRRGELPQARQEAPEPALEPAAVAS